MRQFVGKRAGAALAVVMCWRCASELLQRRRELQVSGQLGPLQEARRRRTIERAVQRAGVAPQTSDPRSATHPSGGFLATSMQRSARAERQRSEAEIFGSAATSPRSTRSTHVGAAVVLALAAVAVTLIPLVRPLADASLWLALAGAALALAAWLLGRRA